MGEVSSITIWLNNIVFYKWNIYFRHDDGITRDYSGYAYTFIGAKFGIWNQLRKLNKTKREPKLVYRWKGE